MTPILPLQLGNCKSGPKWRPYRGLSVTKDCQWRRNRTLPKSTNFYRNRKMPTPSLNPAFASGLFSYFVLLLNCFASGLWPSQLKTCGHRLHPAHFERLYKQTVCLPSIPWHQFEWREAWYLWLSRKFATVSPGFEMTATSHAPIHEASKFQLLKRVLHPACCKSSKYLI